MSNAGVHTNSIFELGKLYFERGDFGVAIEKISNASESAFENKDFDTYLSCQNMLLRIAAEMEDSDKIQAIKESLQDLVLKENVQLTSRTYYTLALCACYRSQYDTGLEYIEKSLALALSNDNKEDICFAINGLAIVYYFLGRYEDSLREIYNLKVFFQVLNLPDLKLTSHVLNGHLHLKMKNYDQAIDVFWQCYEILKTNKNYYMHVSLLFAMGIAYADSGEIDLGKMYLELAKRTIDPENLKYLSKAIDKRLAKIGVVDQSEYDIVYNSVNNSITEKRKGKVDFKNQFILLDLLKLFLKHPGEVYSKEDLVDKVWKQEYDPGIHDNKIYVTIKRLRKLIEPDLDKPKYIYRAKNGYYLNKNTRVFYNSNSTL